MADIKKIIKFSILFIIIFTFLVSLFGSVYMENYNTSEIAKYNSKEISWREFCLNQSPPGGAVFYHKVFPFGFLMIAISTVLILIMSILSLLKVKTLHYNKYMLPFFVLLVFLSYYMLMGAWMDTEPQFYRCVGSFR